MRIAELEEKVDLLSLIARNHHPKRVGDGTYRVDPCPVCGNKDHFTIYPGTNSYSSFNACCGGGKPYKYLIEVEGMSEERAFEELEQLADEQKNPLNSPPTKVEEFKEPLKDYTKSIYSLYAKQTTQDKAYFINRGLTEETIDKHMLSIGDMKGRGTPRAIIPTWKDGKVVYYSGRALTPQEEQTKKYDNPPGRSVIFNSDLLSQLEPGSRIVITEGQIDALTLEQIGYNAVSLGGSNKIKLLEETIAETPGAEKLDYYTLFDNDHAGDDAREKLKITHLRVDLNYKDVNEWYLSEKEKVKEVLDIQFNNLKQPDSLYNYMSTRFTKDIEDYKVFKDRKTGFKNLDEITSLYPGLYVIGGLSTLGKTTFIHQMADQMAEQGEHVLFFSLEMATLEMITKSMARKTVLTKDGYSFEKGVSSLQIRLNDIPNYKREAVQQAIQNYEPISKNFNIIEGNFNTNIDTIKKYIDDYILKNKVSPLVIIDYLQIIPGSAKDRSDKERIDRIVTELKRISRDYNISLIAISSLNRGNYLTPIDFESFKESGGIEYTADVVWGLQLQAIHADIFNTTAKIKEKREIINHAKKSNPRKIELVCLKNRNGISNYSCGFTYYPGYDLFVSEEARKEPILDFDEESERL